MSIRLTYELLGTEYICLWKCTLKVIEVYLFFGENHDIMLRDISKLSMKSIESKRKRGIKSSETLTNAKVKNEGSKEKRERANALCVSVWVMEPLKERLEMIN